MRKTENIKQCGSELGWLTVESVDGNVLFDSGCEGLYERANGRARGN